MRVDPEHAAGAVRLRHAAERAHRDRVVAAEHERHGAAAARVLDERRDPLARAHDRLEVASLRVADLGRLGQADVDVAPVDALAAEARDPLLSPAYRIADGPMSTPRRPAPRSSPAPITATGVGPRPSSAQARRQPRLD